MPLKAAISELFGWVFQREAESPPEIRSPRKLVVILDGTLSSLTPGCETNAGLACKLLRAGGGTSTGVAVYYEAGLQWHDWRDTWAVITGRGINAQIQRAYGWLASNYRVGDEIYLIGYSRGAYAVRSLAGIIGRIGLLRRNDATERNLIRLYRLYSAPKRVEAARAFAKSHCHADVQVHCVAVWDTVKALGLRLPVLWVLANRLHGFHDHNLGAHVRAGFQALALNETRRAFAPVMWESVPGWSGRLEQVWFRGTHGDVGGQLSGRHHARPLANIPFVWLLEKLEESGLPMPPDWRAGFPQDADAPSIGPLAGWSKLFWMRWPRRVGRDPSEKRHISVGGEIP